MVTGTNNERSESERDSSAASDPASIHVEGLTKEYDTQQGQELVFEDVSFDVEPGSFVTLIGKSGSGKSTLLKILSGVVDPTAGSVTYSTPNGVEDVTVGHVFQSPRLLPWNTCVRNIEFVHQDNPAFTPEVAKRYLDMVGLSDHYEKYPTQLSGGQKQRVGIARGLSVDPAVILMDEPFSNLDEITATELREELLDIWKQLHKTIFFVTHDIDEAIELSDRILMLGDGRIYDDLDVDLDRPRDPGSEEFLRFRQNAIDRFQALE